MHPICYSTAVLLLTRRRSVCVMDMNAARPARILPDVHRRPVTHIALNSGSAFVTHLPAAYDLFLTTAVSDGANMWDLPRCVRRFDSHTARQPVSAAFSPCGRYVACGSEDRAVYLYDIRYVCIVFEFAVGVVKGLDFCPGWRKLTAHTKKNTLDAPHLSPNFFFHAPQDWQRYAEAWGAYGRRLPCRLRPGHPCGEGSNTLGSLFFFFVRRALCTLTFLHHHLISRPHTITSTSIHLVLLIFISHAITPLTQRLPHRASHSMWFLFLPLSISLFFARSPAHLHTLSLIPQLISGCADGFLREFVP
eukprot:m.180239 g.180239  ORF g.180239 m.180239 type:complete len:306 (-) comp15374_c0_seq17:235-1152(-)